MGSWLQSAFGALSRAFSRPRRTEGIDPGDIVGSWVKRLGIDLILDVGANEGQFVDRMRDDGYGGQIISFEPLREAFEKLAARHGQSAGWRGFQFALGDREAELKMDVTGNQMMSSSLLPMLPDHVKALPDSAPFKSETVRVRRLDDIAGGLFNGAGRIFLKVDTQGFEDHVLSGARGIMDRVLLMELELSLVPLYQGQRLLPEMMTLVSGMGFVPVDLSRGFADDRRGRLLQVDGLFVRSELADTPPSDFPEEADHGKG